MVSVVFAFVIAFGICFAAVVLGLAVDCVLGFVFKDRI
jgi:hypothetical protein